VAPDTVVLRKDDNTIDDYVVGYCDCRGLTVDGDEFGMLFSGKDEWPMAEVDKELRAWREANNSMRWYITTSRDKYGNTQFDVTVSRDDVEINGASMYSRADCLAWLATNFPNVEEG